MLKKIWKEDRKHGWWETSGHSAAAQPWPVFWVDEHSQAGSCIRPGHQCKKSTGQVLRFLCKDWNAPNTSPTGRNKMVSFSFPDKKMPPDDPAELALTTISQSLLQLTVSLAWSISSLVAGDKGRRIEVLPICFNSMNNSSTNTFIWKPSVF